MTTLQIIPKLKDKTAKFKGTIAAGELVSVTIAGVPQDEGTAYLRLRVVGPLGKTLAMFPMADDDEWIVGEESVSCTLNLNTVQMLKAVPPAATIPLLFVLEDLARPVEGEEVQSSTTPPRALLFKDFCDVTHWPSMRNDDVPVDVSKFLGYIAAWEDQIGKMELYAHRESDGVVVQAWDGKGNRPQPVVIKDGKRGPQGFTGPRGATAAMGYVKCEDTGKFHAVRLAHNVFGKPVLKVLDEEVGEIDVPTKDAVSVIEYGAKGDGVANDTSAFESMAKANVPVIRIPAGTYLLDSRITFKRAVSIIGDGMGVTTLKWVSDSTSSGLEVDALAGEGKNCTTVTGIALVSDVKYKDINNLSNSAIDSALKIDYSNCIGESGRLWPRATMHAIVECVRVSNSSGDGYTGDVGWSEAVVFNNCLGAIVDSCRLNGTQLDDGGYGCLNGVSFAGGYEAQSCQFYMSATSISACENGVYISNNEGQYINACEIVNCNVGVNVRHDGPIANGNHVGGGEPGFSMIQSHVCANHVAVDLYGALTFSIQGCLFLLQLYGNNQPTEGSEVAGVRLGRAIGSDLSASRGCESGVISDNMIQSLYKQKYGQGETQDPFFKFIGIKVGDSCKYNVIKGNTIWDLFGYDSGKWKTNSRHHVTCGIFFGADGGQNQNEPTNNIVGDNTYRDLQYNIQQNNAAQTFYDSYEINVRDFGARGNGVWDDADAFEAAVAAAAAQDDIELPGDITRVADEGSYTYKNAPVCRVVVPPGEYRLGRLLDVGGKDVIWELAPGADVRSTGGGQNYGERMLNGQVVRPGMRITRIAPYGTADFATGFAASIGGDDADKPAPVTGVKDSGELATYGSVDAVGIAGASYSTPPAIRVRNPANNESASVTYDNVVDDNQDDHGRVRFTLKLTKEAGVTENWGNVWEEYTKRLRRGMAVVTRHNPSLVGVLDTWSVSDAEPGENSTVTLTMQDTWYLFGQKDSGGNPIEPEDIAGNIGLDVGVVTKVWGMNSVAELRANGYAKEAIGHEVSLRNFKGDSSEDLDDKNNRMWGFAAFSGNDYFCQAGHLSKGAKFRYGFAAQHAPVGYYHRTTGNYSTAFKSVQAVGATLLSGSVMRAGGPDEMFKVTANGDMTLGSTVADSTGGRTIRFKTKSGGTANPDVDVNVDKDGRLHIKIGTSDYLASESDGKLVFTKQQGAGL